MLSFIVGLCSTFRKQHGFSPNVLYVNQTHFDRLRDDLEGLREYERIRERLGMDIMVVEDVLHPRVGWITGATRLAKAS